MARLVFFLLLVLGLAGLFAWFADRPGELVLTWQGMRYETSLLVAVAGFLSLTGAVLFLWWLASAILRSPQLMRRFFRNRRRDRGYYALSQGLIAAGAGDAAVARRLTGNARNLLGGEPLVDLLDAQTLLLEGKRDQARTRFEDMLADDDTRLLGFRGLYRQAEDQRNVEAARHYAEEAAKASPGLAWAEQAILRHLCLDGDWEAALVRLETIRTHAGADRNRLSRQRAVLLTAKAMAVSTADPAEAARLAQQAIKLEPDLVPAATVGAQALARQGEIRKARRMLETMWKRKPHRDLAGSYVHLEPGESVDERLKHAEKLAALHRDDAEGAMAVAEAAAAAHQWDKTRARMQPILDASPTRRAFMIMAAVEEAETGDNGKVRDWLARAMRAPADPAWIADGVTSRHWLPVSPVSGRLDAFEWKQPAATLGPPEEGEVRLGDSKFASATSTAGEIEVAAEETVEPAAADAEPDGAVAGEPSSDAQDATGDAAEVGQLPRQPDDPGAEPVSEAESRFRLF